MMLRRATRFWYSKSIGYYVGLAIAPLLLTWLLALAGFSNSQSNPSASASHSAQPVVDF